MRNFLLGILCAVGLQASAGIMTPTVEAARVVNAQTAASFDLVDLPHVVGLELTRGSGTLINWKLQACVTGTRQPECGSSFGTLTQPQSTSIRSTIKSVMLLQYCSDHGLACAP